MYNIYYNLDDYGTDGYKFESDANTPVKAFMDAVREMRKVLKTRDVELLDLGDMEFAIWTRGNPQGYLSIKQVGPETSAQGVESG